MTKKRNRIKIGIEIECITNKDLINFNVGDYHDGIKKGKNWNLQHDGSLNNLNSFNNYQCIEFVSKILSSKKTFNNALEEFKSFFKEHNLKDVLKFNSSCGCHIHIGLNNDKKFYDKLNYDKIKELRELFFKKINENNILNDNVKGLILRQYFRNYAKKTTPKEWEFYNHRNSEFNKQSEQRDKGLEWRSVNIRGVKNWEEFFEVFNIIYECIEHLFKVRTKPYKSKYKTIRLNRKELKNLQEQNNKEKVVLKIDKPKEY